MDYFLPSLTIEQITNLFLYGQPTTPTDLTDESLIRAPEVGDKQPAMTRVHLDAFSFMVIGPGRFANAAMSELVDDFMQGKIMAATPGIRQEVDISQFVANGNERRRSLSFQQYDYESSSSDYGSRVYIYNSSVFAIASGAKFIVEADGTRHIWS
jgi:membrane protein insertase Oxa1/YidC/SpoIIIJ